MKERGFAQVLLLGALLAVILGVGIYSHQSRLALGDDQKAQPAQENPKENLIKMGDDSYDTKELTINKGDTVTFENIGTQQRWPASNIHPSHNIYPEFDSKKKMAPGEKWSFKFDQPGVWKFHDHLRPSILGVITVKGEAQAAKAEPKKSLPNPSATDSAKFSKTNIMVALKTETEMRYWLETVGPKKIMEKLLADTGGGSVVDCHQESHTVGRLAYQIYGAVAFKDGNASCHSGYYHGAIEQLLKEKGTTNLSKVINEVCESFATQFGIFECLHGVGHGVLAFDDYDMPKAIKTCQLLKDAYSISSCYGGMFMENIVTAQGSGGSKDHETKWASTDPHFPCNSIDQNFEVQYQCYQMQTSWMLSLFDYNFDRVQKECFKARADMIDVCFKSFGRDAAGHTLRNPFKIRDLCAKVPDVQNYYYICVVGATNVIIDFWGDGLSTQATELCRILPETGKRSCYTTLASRLNDLFNTKERRQLICDTFEADYKNLCVNN
ncbi:MAG: hypothetical protein G01um101419_56 [Parcubacteria group bacterium Gr01-1014_19]|nr:MAG: hypothetical protein G01um101419_56 [Parcubacteria group bacterium Gr01-1014_19]